MKRRIAWLLCLACLGCAEVNDPMASTPPSRGSENNSGVNVRDREPEAKTSFDQNENRQDIDITAAIRQRVVDTKMSVDAQNVKIITQEGQVTLRGPVRSTDEKQTIEAIAKDVAGEKMVASQLEVVEESQ